MNIHPLVVFVGLFNFSNFSIITPSPIRVWCVFHALYPAAAAEQVVTTVGYVCHRDSYLVGKGSDAETKMTHSNDPVLLICK
jgi:hypothetical protein